MLKRVALTEIESFHKHYKQESVERRIALF